MDQIKSVDSQDMLGVTKNEGKKDQKVLDDVSGELRGNHEVINASASYNITHAVEGDLYGLLDTVYSKCESGTLTKTDVSQVILELDRIKNKVGDDYWRATVIERVMNHPLKKYIHQDPCTYRSFSKPRGYAGDAELIDFLYSCEPQQKLSEIGRTVFDVIVSHSAGFSVRERATIISEHIDNTCKRKPNARILSVACGHLLELSFSRQGYLNNLGEIVGLDQDEESLRVANNRHKLGALNLVNKTIKDIFKAPESLGKYDFIYSSGLYDYLDNKVARKLNKVLFGMLKSEGELLITNFTPSIPGIGYMETFMGWDLIYRELSDMEVITDSLPSKEIETKTTFRATTNSIIYTRVQKK